MERRNAEQKSEITTGEMRYIYKVVCYALETEKENAGGILCRNRSTVLDQIALFSWCGGLPVWEKRVSKNERVEKHF